MNALDDVAIALRSLNVCAERLLDLMGRLWLSTHPFRQ